MSEQLKPCPFCDWGTIGEISTFLSWFGYHTIGCYRCKTRTKPYKTIEEAIEVWNRRTDNG